MCLTLLLLSVAPGRGVRSSLSVVGSDEVVVSDVPDIGDIDGVSDAPQGRLYSGNHGGLDKHFSE